MESLEQLLNQLVGKVSAKQDVTEELNRALTLYPYSAALYFIRGSEFAEHEEYLQAMNDFAKALVLEPEFHLVRLQYILCCFKTEGIALVPVLVQPLLLAGGTFALIGELIVSLFSQSVDEFDVRLQVLKNKEDMLPAVWLNLLSLRDFLAPIGPGVDSYELVKQASPEISSILLEIYKQKH